MFTGRSRRELHRDQLAAEKPDAQKDPRTCEGQDGRSGDGDRQNDGQPAGGGVQIVAGACQIRGRLAGRAQRSTHLVTDQRDSVGIVTGGVQVVGDAVGAVLHLTAHLGDRRHRGVHSKPDEHPDRGPDRDRYIAEQLGEQPSRSGRVGQESHES
ncbi:Uncharacterised protein [Mycobacteroides abscessus subsp. massiliense]|nr:Uncharacterised protein [Mycobacteroides abscessus subsp. massiliense]